MRQLTVSLPVINSAKKLLKRNLTLVGNVRGNRKAILTDRPMFPRAKQVIIKNYSDFNFSRRRATGVIRVEALQRDGTGDNKKNLRLHAIIQLWSRLLGKLVRTYSCKQAA